MALTPEGTPYVESSDLVANYPAASLSLANRVDLVGVLPFADSAARDAAITSPSDGQYVYLQDTNTTQFYNGATWQTAGTTPGLNLVTPTSIANSGGSASASGGQVSFTSVNSVSLNGVLSATYDNYRMVISSTFSGDNSMHARLRLSGSDATGTTYFYQRVTGSASSASSTGQSSIAYLYLGDCSGNLSAWSIDMFNPAKASETQALTLNVRSNNSIQTVSGVHTTATAYDGITFFPAAGTMSGTIRVYGYQNS
jgi:hypothetical protein